MLPDQKGRPPRPPPSQGQRLRAGPPCARLARAGSIYRSNQTERQEAIALFRRPTL